MRVYHDQDDYLVIGNALEVPFPIFDLAVFDPPYNMGRQYDRHTNDNLGESEYRAFLRSCLERLTENAHPARASIWCVLPPIHAARFVLDAMECGWSLRNWCIWHYRFGQHTDAKYIPSHVAMPWIVRGKPPFNAESVLVDSDRSRVYGDKRTNQKSKGVPGKRVPLDVWEFPRITGNNLERREGHDNQLPERLVERLLLGASSECDLVFDPFAGSGTVATVARKLNRRTYSIEISPELGRSAWQRITEIGAVR